MAPTRCAICNRTDANSEYGIVTEQTSFECKRCGKFLIDAAATSSPQNSPDVKLIPYLSSYIRRNQRDESEPPPRITGENWKDLALAEKEVAVPQKLEMLLHFLAQRTDVPGEVVQAVYASYDLPESIST